MGVLPHDEILRIRAAMISAGLLASRRALLAGLSREYAASLETANNPSEQVLNDLDALNDTGKLADGSFPLATWLKNAQALAGPRKEEDIFRLALERCLTAFRPSGTTSDVPHKTPAPQSSSAGTVGRSTYSITIQGSTIGAVGIGSHPDVDGDVSMPASLSDQKPTTSNTRFAGQKRLIFFAASALIVATLLYAFYPRVYEVRGQIWHSRTHKPLAGVEVVFVGLECDGGVARSDAQGLFRLTCRIPPFLRITNPRVRLRMPDMDAFCEKPVQLLSPEYVTVIEVDSKCRKHYTTAACKEDQIMCHGRSTQIKCVKSTLVFTECPEGSTCIPDVGCGQYGAADAARSAEDHNK